MASPSPGHGGIVTPIACNGSAESDRNWKAVPTGIATDIPGATSMIVVPVARAKPHAAAAGQEVPHLVDRAVRHGARDGERRQAESRHAAACGTHQHTHRGAIRCDDVRRVVHVQCSEGHARRQSYARFSVSATSAGRVLPSISIVLSKVIRTPPSMSSTFFKVWCRRTRDPTCTGAVKRTRFEP